jgi:hypothetical protein
MRSVESIRIAPRTHKYKARGMKHVAQRRLCERVPHHVLSVGFVAEQWASKGLHMHSNLVRSPRFWKTAHMACLRTRKHPNGFISR